MSKRHQHHCGRHAWEKINHAWANLLLMPCLRIKSELPLPEWIHSACPILNLCTTAWQQPRPDDDLFFWHKTKPPTCGMLDNKGPDCRMNAGQAAPLYHDALQRLIIKQPQYSTLPCCFWQQIHAEKSLSWLWYHIVIRRLKHANHGGMNSCGKPLKI